MFFSAGLAPGGGTGGASSPGATDPAADRRAAGTAGRAHRARRARHLRPASPPPSAPPTPRPPPTGRLSPALRGAAAPLLPGGGRRRSPRRRCWCRASRTRCSGWTRPTPTPARSQRPAARCAVIWYNGGHDGGSAGQRDARPIGAWFRYYLAGSGTGAGHGIPLHGRQPGRDGRRTPPAARWRRPRTRASAGAPAAHRAAPAARATRSRLVTRRGRPGRDHRLPGLGGALGSTATASPLRRRAARADRRFTLRARRRPDAARRRPAGRPARSPAVPGRAGTRTRRCCSSKVDEVAAGGTRTLLGGAVAPIRVAGPRRRLPRAGRRRRCPAASRRSRRATG